MERRHLRRWRAVLLFSNQGKHFAPVERSQFAMDPGDRRIGGLFR
jgi:hypothetical protein